jgi:hypothetical protein
VSRNVEKLKLKAGDWVEVRSREEILAMLDERGRYENLPFMPEMLEACGSRFRVAASAHKTCDPARSPWTIRRLKNVVHLGGSRCDGGAHAGCQAGCLIFWKEAWLKRVDGDLVRTDELRPARSRGGSGFCSVENLLAASARSDQDGGIVYSCQATQLLDYSTAMSPWNPSQYILDVTSRNLSTMLADETRVGRLLEWLLAVIRLVRGLVIGMFTGRMGWTFYPALHGAQDKTPVEELNLQPGELVEVCSIEEIVATLNKQNRNRGLLFDGEMTPYCGGIYRVLRRVNRIINENTGRMMEMKFPCIVLEGVVCKSDYHRLCPRAIYSYWRENWLKRADPRTRMDAIREQEFEPCQQR